MTKAPLSRIVILTEDGSTVRPTEMVAIPPRNVVPPPPNPTIANTLGTSTLPGTEVSGFTPPANALDTRLTALGV